MGPLINEINCLRKHLSARSRVGNWRAPVAPATLVTLLSAGDVVGSPLDVIASGPTVPDRTTWQDAWAVVERHGWQRCCRAPCSTACVALTGASRYDAERGRSDFCPGADGHRGR